MATLEQIAEGIKRAHAAGNVEDVKKLGAAYRQMQAQPAPVAAVPAQEGRIPLISDFNDFSNAVRTGFTEGATFGFGDELQAGVEAPFRAVGDMVGGKGFDLGRAFDDGLKNTRAAVELQKEKNPIAATVGDIVGSLSTGGTLAKGGLTLMNGARSIPGLVARGAAEGAVYGGVSGFGRSDGDLGDRARDAAWGAGLGGALGGAGGAVAGALSARAAKAAVPTVDDLKAQAGALFDKAEASGVTFGQAEVKTLADDVAAKVISEGIDPALHPRATAALQRLIDAGNTGMTVKNAQTLRRVIAAAGKDPMNPDEGRIVGMMLDKFDNMVSAKTPDLADARAIYHQAKKGELIEQTIELAGSRAGQFSGSGYENALRTEFRALQRKIIKGQLKGLSAEEIAAINKVADGGSLENIARYVGKLAPTGVVSFGAGAGVPFMVGNALGGPGMGAAAAGATMGAGLLGRSAATAMTGNNATRAALLARSGGRAIPRGTVSSPEVVQALIAAGADQMGGVPIAVRRFSGARAN